MITGQTGSWKSYQASALRQFKTVKYIRASQLIDDLNRAEALDTYREEYAEPEPIKHLIQMKSSCLQRLGPMLTGLRPCLLLLDR